MVALFIPCVILYSLGLLAMVTILLLNLRVESAGSTSNVFFYFAACFCALRTVWVIILELPSDNVTHLINRMCWTLFICALFVILLCWYSVLSRKSLSVEPAYFLSGSRCVFASVMGPFFVWAIVDSVYYAYFRPEGVKEGSPMYNAFILFFSVANLLLSLAAVAIGGKLVLLALRTAKQAQNNSRGGTLELGPVRKLTLLAVLVAFSFGLRFLLFMYRFIADKSLDEDLFMSLAYLVPELLPLTVQSILFAMRMRKARQRQTLKMMVDRSGYTTLTDGSKGAQSGKASYPLRQSQTS